MLQRTDEWVNITDRDLEYHTKQWDIPKRSTIAFEEFIAHRLTKSHRVLDLAAGSGAPSAYLAQIHSSTDFVAMDYAKELVTIGESLARSRGIDNLRFKNGDWFNLEPELGTYDGVISLQTLSWLPEFERPLAQIAEKINPKWMAFTSLFYEGDISCKIEVEEHLRKRKTFYNVYSIPQVRSFLLERGYEVTSAVPFVIDIDIERPSDIDHMGTYTRRLEDGTRLQISGPLLMSWYTIVADRIS